MYRPAPAVPASEEPLRVMAPQTPHDSEPDLPPPLPAPAKPDGASPDGGSPEGGLVPERSQFTQRLASFGLGETPNPLLTRTPEKKIRRAR